MARPTLFPVSLVLHGCPVLVVGGGPVAARKVGALVDCGAHVTVIAPDITPEIETLGCRSIERRRYVSGDVDGHRLVIAATGDRDVNHRIYSHACAAGIFVNTADDPEACTFMLPSVLRRGPVTVAVSTSGASPALAVWLRRQLDGAVPPELGTIADMLADARAALHRQGRSSETVPWETLFDGELAALVADGKLAQARQLVAERAGL